MPKRRRRREQSSCRKKAHDAIAIQKKRPSLSPFIRLLKEPLMSQASLAMLVIAIVFTFAFSASALPAAQVAREITSERLLSHHITRMMLEAELQKGFH